MRRILTLLLSALTALAVVLVNPGAAQADHTFYHSCSVSTAQVPTVYQNATKDGSFVSSGVRVVCHEGSSTSWSHDVVDVYIHITLQVRSAVTGLWHTRDTGSARWTGAIGNYPATVTAYASDVCENRLSRQHRIRIDDAWYRTGDGGYHYLSQGSYSPHQPYLNCGN